MADTKDKIIAVTATEEFRREFQITAELRGLTMSALGRILMLQAIREEKQRQPEAFLAQKKNCLALRIVAQPLGEHTEKLPY